MQIRETDSESGAQVDEILDEPTCGPPIMDTDVSKAIDLICDYSASSQWETDVELELGPKRWRTHATSSDRKHLLYVLLQNQIPRFAEDRIRLAARDGIRATIALNLSALYDANLVQTLVEVDAEVIVLDDIDPTARLKPRPLLIALAEIKVPYASVARREIAKVVWDRIDEGTAQEKGRRLEQLLAFAFSQVQDLRVVEHNFRNDSEEIDLVLQVQALSSRAWQNPGVPFLLVEAKNRSDKASQQMMSTLITKLQTKRGKATIALMISLGGFTEDAKVQEIRFSTQGICVVMIDRVQLAGILEAEDIDAALETVVRRSLLR